MSAIAPSVCRPAQPLPCMDFLCSVCLHRKLFDFAGDTFIGEENKAVSPTQPLSLDDRARLRRRPRGVPRCQKWCRRHVESQRRHCAPKGGEPPPLGTPKRAAGEGGEHPAAATTPSKLPRPAPPEPTNSDLMAFLQQMQAQQTQAIQGITDRLTDTETKLNNLESNTAKRFLELESR